jgi:hypothetical protein
MGEVERALATEAGQYVRDARSLEMEIERVAAEAELRDDARAASPSAAGGMRDPFRELLESAARELGGTAQAAGIAAQARATQLVQALSGGRVTALGVDDDGNVLAAQGGRESPVSALAPSDRDVAYLALKLALVERALARAKGAVIVEDAFAGWPEAARRVAARILKQLAGPAQIVHATADPSFREVADHVV